MERLCVATSWTLSSASSAVFPVKPSTATEGPGGPHWLRMSVAGRTMKVDKDDDVWGCCGWLAAFGLLLTILAVSPATVEVPRSSSDCCGYPPAAGPTPGVPEMISRKYL